MLCGQTVTSLGSILPTAIWRRTTARRPTDAGATALNEAIAWPRRSRRADRQHVRAPQSRQLQGLDGRDGRGVGSAAAGVVLRSAGAAASAEFRRLAAASAVTSAEIRSRTPSSPGPDVVFNSLAARRRASRRSSRDVVASNSGSGRCWSAIAYSGRQGIDVQYPMSPVPPEEPSPVSGEGSLLPLRHHRLGCDHQRTDRRGVLQCGPHDLGGPRRPRRPAPCLPRPPRTSRRVVRPGCSRFCLSAVARFRCQRSVRA